MSRITTDNPVNLTAGVLALVAFVLLPWLVQAQGTKDDVASQVKAQIEKDNQYTREHLMDREGGYSKHGSLEYWSSGGLMQWVEPDEPVTKYESFSLTPKHIKVIVLPGGEAAIAMYYSEGSMQVKGGPLVSHYMTRVMQVHVKEEGEWKVRAAHWSPVAAGAGTTQSSID